MLENVRKMSECCSAPAQLSFQFVLFCRWQMLSRLMMMALLCIFSDAACVNYMTKGYYIPSHIFVAGLPPVTNGRSFKILPNSVTVCQLEDLHSYCVDEINKYRAGILKFSDGSSDPSVPLPPMNKYTGNFACSNADTFGDFFANANAGGGGCAGAHTNAGSCPRTGSWSQNSCCARYGTTVANIKSTLDGCLQQMWNEGIGLPDNAPWSSANGHWKNMRSALPYAHCGFAFDESGAMWMNQDFSGGQAVSAPPCSCASKSPGDSDGCGGLCVDANGSTIRPPDVSEGTIAAAVLVPLFLVAAGIVMFIYYRRNKEYSDKKLSELSTWMTAAASTTFIFISSVAISFSKWINQRCNSEDSGINKHQDNALQMSSIELQVPIPLQHTQMSYPVPETHRHLPAMLVNDPSNVISETRPLPQLPPARRVQRLVSQIDAGTARSSMMVVSSPARNTTMPLNTSEEPVVNTSKWEAYDDPATGTTYYYNRETGVSVWTIPETVE